MTLCLPWEMSLSKEVLWAVTLIRNHVHKRPGRLCLPTGQPEREGAQTSVARRVCQDSSGDGYAMCLWPLSLFPDEPPQHTGGHSSFVCAWLWRRITASWCVGPHACGAPPTVPRSSAGTGQLSTDVAPGWAHRHFSLTVG